MGDCLLRRHPALEHSTKRGSGMPLPRWLYLDMLDV
jgi:hypothetical protein